MSETPADNPIEVLDEEVVKELRAWLATIPLSRPTENLASDFSDGVLLAEVLAHFKPAALHLLEYVPSECVDIRKMNWDTLNDQVLAKLGYRLDDSMIQDLLGANVGTIEKILLDLRQKLESEGRLNKPSMIPKAKRARGLSRERDPSENRVPHTTVEIDKVGLKLALELLRQKDQEFKQGLRENARLDKKLTRLDYLVELKVMRIKDLFAQINQLGALYLQALADEDNKDALPGKPYYA